MSSGVGSIRPSISTVVPPGDAWRFAVGMMARLLSRRQMMNLPNQKTWNEMASPSNLAMAALIGFLLVGHATDWKILGRKAKANSLARFAAPELARTGSAPFCAMSVRVLHEARLCMPQRRITPPDMAPLCIMQLGPIPIRKLPTAAMRRASLRRALVNWTNWVSTSFATRGGLHTNPSVSPARTGSMHPRRGASGWCGSRPLVGHAALVNCRDGAGNASTTGGASTPHIRTRGLRQKNSSRQNWK